MSEKQTKKSKKTYIFSPKKEALVKRMIFDSHQLNLPLSCYELRPIQENQSNQNDIIFDPKSSSLRQISDIEKNSPYQLDRLIQEHGYQRIYLQKQIQNAQKQFQSSSYAQKQYEMHESLDENSSPLKRQNSVNQNQFMKYQKMMKLHHTEEYSQNKFKERKMSGNFSYINNQRQFLQLQKYRKEKKEFQYNMNKQKKISHKKPKHSQKQEIQALSFSEKQFFCSDSSNSPYINQQPLIHQNPKNYNKSLNSHQFSTPKASKKNKQIIKIQEQQQEQYSSIHKRSGSKSKSSNLKKEKKIQDNMEYELINEYIELMSYASLIEDMITIYDPSPLFHNPIDFDSQEQNDTNQKKEKYINFYEAIEQIQNCNHNTHSFLDNNDSIQQFKLSTKLPVKIGQEENQVKIQQNSVLIQQQQNYPPSSSSIKSLPYSSKKKQALSLLQKLKLDQAPEPEKVKVLKQIKFQRSKTYFTFYQPIQQLRPYIKKMTIQEKQIFLKLKKQLKEIKDIIDYFEKKKALQKRQHVCKICLQEFDSGRQLGGHMSRKHPGKAIQYSYKKQLHKIKKIERNRRRYFKDLRNVVKIEHEEQNQIDNKKVKSMQRLKLKEKEKQRKKELTWQQNWEVKEEEFEDEINLNE